MDQNHEAAPPARPEDVDPKARGLAALEADWFDEAADCLDLAARSTPEGDPQVIAALAEARLGQGRYGDAEVLARALVERDPKDVEARGLLGAALARRGELVEAVRLLARVPDRPAFHLARAFTFDRIGDLDEAERAARRALALAPARPEAFTALGSVLTAQGRFGEALAAFGRALKVDPAYAPAHLGRGRLRLTLGDFRAWPELEWRLNVPGLAPVFPPVGPAWDGAPPAGKTILLIAEPGRSDTLMFVRYAAPLKQAGARVVLACRPALAALLTRAEGVDRVVTDPSELADEAIDAHADLLSVPALTGAGPATVPREPYLSADPERSARWAAGGANPDVFRVVIHWAGDEPDRRSIALEAFAPLAAVPGVRLVSVQKGRGSNEAPLARFPLLDLAPTLDPGPDAFVDTAAVIARSDLVVTNDGPIAHLAGALGVPVRVALPVGADWRWMTERPDSPWYPTMRLYRQQRQGDWSDVFAAIAEALRAEAAALPAHRALRAG